MLNSSLLQLIWLPNTTKKIVWHGLSIYLSVCLSVCLSVSIFSKVKNKKIYILRFVLWFVHTMEVSVHQNSLVKKQYVIYLFLCSA